MNYTTVNKPTWDKDQSAIDCLVNFVSIGEVPFSAKQNDGLEHGREIYARCIAGDFGPIANYVFLIDEGDDPQSTAPFDASLIPVTISSEVL